MQRKDRSSNFELMRIFAMFLIITYHYALFSSFRFLTVIKFRHAPLVELIV